MAALVLAVAIPLCAVLGYTYYSAAQREEATAAAGALQLARIVAIEIGQELTAAQDALEVGAIRGVERAGELLLEVLEVGGKQLVHPVTTGVGEGGVDRAAVGGAVHPGHEAVALEAAQGLGEHLLRDAPDAGGERSKPLRAGVERDDDQDGPPVADPVEQPPRRAGRVERICCEIAHDAGSSLRGSGHAPQSAYSRDGFT